MFTGTVSENQSNPPHKDINARFTTVPLTPSDQYFGRYCRFLMDSKAFFYN